MQGLLHSCWPWCDSNVWLTQWAHGSDIAIYKTEPSLCLNLSFNRLPWESMLSSMLVLLVPRYLWFAQRAQSYGVTVLTSHVLSSTLSRYQWSISFDKSDPRSLPQQTLGLASRWFTVTLKSWSASLFPHLPCFLTCSNFFFNTYSACFPGCFIFHYGKRFAINTWQIHFPLASLQIFHGLTELSHKQ